MNEIHDFSLSTVGLGLGGCSASIEINYYYSAKYISKNNSTMYRIFTIKTR